MIDMLREVLCDLDGEITLEGVMMAEEMLGGDPEFADALATLRDEAEARSWR